MLMNIANTNQLKIYYKFKPNNMSIVFYMKVIDSFLLCNFFWFCNNPPISKAYLRLSQHKPYRQLIEIRHCTRFRIQRHKWHHVVSVNMISNKSVKTIYFFKVKTCFSTDKNKKVYKSGSVVQAWTMIPRRINL